jgi:hypothetical protein
MSSAPPPSSFQPQRRERLLNLSAHRVSGSTAHGETTAHVPDSAGGAPGVLSSSDEAQENVVE